MIPYKQSKIKLQCLFAITELTVSDFMDAEFESLGKGAQRMCHT